MFRDTYTALVTPFRDGAIDAPAFQRLIERQISAGISGIVPVGTTGESPTLSHEERKQIIRLAVETADRRCQVMAGTGSNSTQHAIEATREAEELGVDGALVVAPYYNKPSQEGLFRHFQKIAQSTSLPIMLYNIPARCGVDLAPDTVERLAGACGSIIAIKEASGSVERVSELCTRLPREFAVLSGDDSLTLPFMAVGAVGVVSVASNLLPADVVALVQTFAAGDANRARDLHQKLFGIFKDLFLEPNPVPVKTALSWRGEMSAEVRLPLCEMTLANQDRLRATIENFGNSNG